MIVLGAAPEGVDGRWLVDHVRDFPGGLLHVARDDARLTAMQQVLEFFAPDLESIVLPAWDCLPYDRVSPNAELCARRMHALHRLVAPATGPRIVLTTVNALLQRLPARAFMAATRFQAKLGERIDRATLDAFLLHSGYDRVGTVMEPGEFAMRGGLIDLFPPGHVEPLRIDLFGDVLDGLRRFDPLSQRTTSKESEFVLLPVSEFSLDTVSIQRFRTGYRELFGAVTDEDPLYQAISEGRKHIGMEHWLPLFHARLETLFDYLPDTAITLDHLAMAARDERLVSIVDYYDARRTAAESGLAAGAPPYKPLPPEQLYLTAEEWDQAMSRRPVAKFDPFAYSENARGTINLGGEAGRDFAPERAQGANVYDAVASHIAVLRGQGKHIVLAAFSAGSRDRLGLVLGDHGIGDLAVVANYSALIALAPGVAGLAVLPVEHGFATADLVVIGEQDILGDRLVRPRRQRRGENFIADAGALTAADLVVHVDHGIGRYQGLQTIDVLGAPHDCLLLVYEGGDRLYLPVENIEMLSRFGSDDSAVALDRLGGAAWQGRKARLKQRLKDMAEELIKIAAVRQLHQADRLLPPPGLFDEFCARFAFDETEDQARAIADTLVDLASGQPMDRLICGDVGFGKTEVALRSAFVAAMEGDQVAIICPTTLLCRQHFQTFAQRFHGLPIRIEQLSRMVPTAKATLVKRGIQDGSIDIVIGTHALLGKTVQFKRLGLLVIDEEQHFGVRHKEQLKALKSDVHVLTLTATPIPRTLQMALSGVRELSIIATPPVDRLAVRTFVMPFDPVVAREALLREHYRGGQAFYVCPRIEDLPDAAGFLKAHVPEVKYAIAHGRMAPTQIEEVMTAFYEGRIDVLVSTNIVESGLDIPAANTLIVHRADLFGLAQLYQLRGRIGRSKLRAYSYFTLPPRKPPTASAAKRLKVLQSLDSLGAGFTLASHDLDLRGAGNLLGEEQSGHIREIGFELYQEMLQEAVAAARGEADAARAEKWSPQIALGTSVLIPESYVADLNLRLQLYRRVADLEDRATIDAFAAEMIDRFGPLPAEVQHLLQVVALKKICRDAGIEKIEVGPRGATLAFRHNRFADPAGLVAFIGRQGIGRPSASAKLRPDHRLVFVRDWPTQEERLKGAMELASGLAALALAAPQMPALGMAAGNGAGTNASRAANSKT